MKTVTVRLPDDLHRAVKVRCAERGDSFEGIAREAFWAYVDGGLGAGEPRAETPAPTVVAATVTPRRSSPAPSSRPASARKCVREARHHINHSGRPCPECGYPMKEGAVT